jgi:hypothetical protein
MCSIIHLGFIWPYCLWWWWLNIHWICRGPSVGSSCSMPFPVIPHMGWVITICPPVSSSTHPTGLQTCHNARHSQSVSNLCQTVHPTYNMHGLTVECNCVWFLSIEQAGIMQQAQCISDTYLCCFLVCDVTGEWQHKQWQGSLFSSPNRTPPTQPTDSCMLAYMLEKAPWHSYLS